MGYGDDGGRREASLKIEGPEVSEGKGKLIGLCVGLDDHSEVRGVLLPDSRYCEADARSVARLLEGECGGIVHSAAEVKVFTGRERCGDGSILSYLRTLAGRVSRHDRVVLYLAGQNASPELESLRTADRFALACATRMPPAQSPG